MERIPTTAVATPGLAIGSDAILVQEAHGAAAVRSSQDIPTENPGREKLALFGIEVGKPHPDDRIFTSATFPAGWKRVSTGHSMWTYLVPPWSEGPVFAIFYKAAFYDRSANMGFRRRYDLTTYEDDGNTQVNEARVRDRGLGLTLFSVPFECTDPRDHWDAGKPALKQCEEWAKANLPADWGETVGPWLRLMAERA